MNGFIRSRILKFACDSLPYLIGADRSGPLSDLDDPSDWIADQARVFNLSWRDNRALTFADEDFRAPGLYVLIGGRIKSTLIPDKILDYRDLPIVFVDIPGRVVSPDHQYTVEEDSTILWIGAGALLNFEPERFFAIVAVIRRELSKLFIYDIFISYTSHDRDDAIGWKEAFEQAGLRVYVDLAATLQYFPEKIAAAMLDSLILVPLVSARTSIRPASENWVLSEVEFRKRAFEHESANVLPIRLPGGNVEAIADGFTPIEGSRPMTEVVEQVRTAVEQVRNGHLPPPFSLQRKLGLKIRRST
jgi:TIR domain